MSSAMMFSRKPELRARFGVKSDTTLHNWINQGLLPKFVRLGPNVAGLPSTEVDAIVSARIAGKNDDDIRALVTRLEAQRSQG